MDAYKGEIEVESEKGKGTTFRVFFPLFQGQNQTQPDNRVSNNGLTGLSAPGCIWSSGKVTPQKFLLRSQERIDGLYYKSLHGLIFIVVLYSNRLTGLDIYRQSLFSPDEFVRERTPPYPGLRRETGPV